MSKSILVFILSLTIALQPLAFYPSNAYAQTAEPVNSFSTLIKKIQDAKNNFVRNKVYGDTPGSNPNLVPSTSTIEALDRELQNEKMEFFSNLRKTLANPTLITNRDAEKAPVEWTELVFFYAAAAEIEHLKALNGTLPNPAVWKQKYEFKVQAQDIVDPFFTVAIGAYMHELKAEKSEKYPVYIKFISNNLNDSFYEFQLNPLLATSFAEKQMAVASGDEPMLRMAQLTAANQLYDNQILIHSLNRHDLDSIPDLPAQLKEKFPLLKWKRDNSVLINSIQDQRAMMSDLAEKKIGPFAEKLTKEKLFFFDKPTIHKVLQTINPEKTIDIEAPLIGEVLEEAHEFEQSPLFMISLQTLLLTTDFKPSQSKQFWTQNIKLAITQAKFMLASGYVLNRPMNDAYRESLRTIIEERKHIYLNETLQALNINPIIKQVKDEKTYLSETRHDFQKALWLNAKRVESSLTVENEDIDLTVIADPLFIKYLNENLNKEEIQFKAQPTKGIRADKGVIIDPIQPLTAQWLQTLFQPGQKYGVLKDAYMQTILNAIKDFRVTDKKAPESYFDQFGTPIDPDLKGVKAWIQNSTYDPNAVKLDQGPLNSIALNLHAKAPQARKQELIELIKIGENLGFFLKHDLGATPKVSQMPWTPEWMKAYHAVITKRTFVENPLLIMKLSDTQHESAWEAFAYSVPRMFGYKSDEKSLWQELAPLYTNEQEETDEQADVLVSTYLNKMQEIIIKDLHYVSEEGAKAEVNWMNPLSWHLIGRDKPYEFSTEFKKIITRSSILTVNLHQYSHFQNNLLKLQQSMEYDSAESKAYERLFNYYVMYGMIATIGLTVLGAVLKSSIKGFALFNKFQTEALYPVLGPNLTYYNISAMAWLGLDIAGSGVHLFSTQRSLRDRTNDMTLTSAVGPGLIDTNMKTLGEGLYNSAQLKWWTEVTVLVVVGTAIVVGMRYIPRMMNYLSNSSTRKEIIELQTWSEKMTRWADNVGFQKNPEMGKDLQVGLLKGDIEAMAHASLANVTKLTKDPKFSWANAEALKANINLSAQLLEQEAANIAKMWAEIAKQYVYQFKSLRIEPGQWDIALFNKRAKEIEFALINKQITREQAWILKQNLSELQKAFGPYAEAMLQIDGIGPAILERIASTPSQVKFSNTGQVSGFKGDKMPESWWIMMKQFKKQYPKDTQAFTEMLKVRERINNLKWVKDPTTNAWIPSRGTPYDIESKRKFLEAHEKAVQNPSPGFK